MRAFVVAGQALLSFYNDLFVFVAMSLLWWVTGGIFVAIAAVLGLLCSPGADRGGSRR